MNKYTQLTIEEREKIQKGIWEGKSLRSIAYELNRSPSSISREIKRNLPCHQLRYTPRLAQERAHTTTVQRGKRTRLKHPDIQRYVVEKLKNGYSPEQISGRFSSNQTKYTISHEAIYQFIYAQYHRSGYGACHGLDLRKYLKRRHKQRKRKHIPFPKERGKLQGITSILERPAIVDSRIRVGDWEGDAIISRQSKAGLNTLVDRKSGLVLISKLKQVNKEYTTQAIFRKLHPMPCDKRHTLTLDNGKENAGHKDISRSLDIEVYFARPYCSNDRATNENTNGLIRWYLPKGTDFATIHPHTIQAIEKKLNNRPRKRLNWKTPFEVFNKSVALKR